MDSTVAAEIIEWASCHTFYVQQICNRVFAATEKKATSEIWKHQAFLLLKEQETIFFNYRNILTNPQWQLLKAIAREEKVYSPTAANFISNYKLSSSASVLRSLNALLKYDLIYFEFVNTGKKYYSVYDIWLQRWCKG